jgi:hypothetical protein
MRRIVTSVAASAALFGFAGSASARVYEFRHVTSLAWETSETRGVLPNDSYIVYTGVGTPAGAIGLAESSTAPARDDAVIFNGVEEQINDYVASVPPPLVGQRRFVTESTVDNGNGTKTDTFVIRAIAAGSDTPADLWPQGLALSGVAATAGAFGIGGPAGLPASLGGTNPLALEPGTTVLSANVDIVTDGVASGPFDLPLSFFAPSPAAWNGSLVVLLTGGAGDAGVDSQITVKITTVPEPAAAGLLGGCAVLLLRRRRD